MEVRGISPKKCESIAAEVQQIFALRGLMQFLVQYDIRSKYAMRAYQRWGSGAVDMIAANPYLLCSHGIDLEFQKADAWRREWTSLPPAASAFRRAWSTS